MYAMRGIHGYNQNCGQIFPFRRLVSGGQLEAFIELCCREKKNTHTKMQVHTDLNDYFKKHIKRMMKTNEKKEEKQK